MLLLEGRGKKGNSMPLPQNFNEFRPSKKLAEEYFAQWPATAEYTNYQCLHAAFAQGGTLLDRIQALNNAYNCTRPFSFATLVQHLQNIHNLQDILMQGENIVDTVSNIGGRNMFCFGTMYCHHVNPDAYYGYSSLVHKCLVELNKRDHFYGKALKYDELRNYGSFSAIMQALVDFYQIEGIGNTKLDIMLRRGSELL